MALSVLGSALASVMDGMFETLQNSHVEALTPMELYLEIRPGGGAEG